MKQKLSILRNSVLFILSFLILSSCDNDITELDMEREVNILEFTINGREGIIDNENSQIHIIMPAGTSDLSALVPEISVSPGATVQPESGTPVNLNNPRDYMVFAGNVYKRYRVSASVLKAEILSFSIDGTEGAINHQERIITIPLPFGTDLTNLTPEIELSPETTVSPGSGVAQDFSNPVVYTVSSGNVQIDYTAIVTVAVTPDLSKGPIGSKLGFLGNAEDRFTLPDDDEQAAADWFFTEYPDGEFISWDYVMAGFVNIYDYKMIWWHYDENFEIPSQAAHEEVIGIFSDYMKDGGNLYLSGHAVQYFWLIGRLTQSYPMAIGSGSGFENNDTWSIGVNLPGVDHRNHPIYQGLDFDENDGFFTFPTIGPGWKEDHNHVILEIANVHGYPNNHPGAYVSFTETNQVEWLGVWGGIRDFFMAGVLELLPNDEFNGRGIYMGIGGFEWNQNAQGTINPSGINPYQDNIETVSGNIINYLNQN
jgi:hypothetical protein